MNEENNLENSQKIENFNATVQTIDDDNCELDIKKIENDKFIKLESIDLENLASIFNTFSTNKTYATGFFNLALIATNISQIKKLFLKQNEFKPLLDTYKISWNVIDITLIAFVSLSLILQIFVGVLLIFLARRSHGEFLNEDKREELIKNNNSITCLVLAISIINVFINIFMNI